jgi:hypothetical protein
MHRINTSASLAALALAATSAVLTACNGDGISQTESVLHLNITDAPLTNATKVWLQFTGVEVKPTGSAPQSFMFPTPAGYDLLTLQNGNAATLLGDTTVAAGDYEWVRLILDPVVGSSYVIDGTGQHALRIPSGAETGLKLVRGFTMPAGGRADFTIDFVLQKSIIAPPGQSPDYLMKPVLRMTNNVEVGTIAGTFAPQSLSAIPACTGKAPMVYLYEGGSVTPDDIYNPTDGSADTIPLVDPLVVSAATLNSSTQYTYRVAFVPAGTYTVAFSCNSDDPLVDENQAPATPLVFTVYPQPVVVAPGQISTANF